MKWLTLFFISAALFTITKPEAYAQFSDNDQDFKTTLELNPDGNGSVITYSFDAPLKQSLTYQLDPTSYDLVDKYDHNGMAVYLGQQPPVKILPKGTVKHVKVKTGETIISDGEWNGFKGRFKGVLARTSNGTVNIEKTLVTITWPEGVLPDLVVMTGELDSTPAETAENLANMSHLKYSHLPRWMRVICRSIEWLLTSIQSLTGLGWAISLIFLALIIRILLLPISNLTLKFQNTVNEHKAALAPIIKDIKSKHKGEVAHNKTMAAYKARGITPYYTLKPLLATAVGLPILIAIFNVLGEMGVLRDAKFLWIKSLAYPDSLVTFSKSIPIFGNSLNLLPFLMTAVTVISVQLSKIKDPGQKRNLYLMAALFFVLFYPFPAGMVLYWTLYNVLQMWPRKKQPV